MVIKKIFYNQNDFWTVVFTHEGRDILAEVDTREEAQLLMRHFNRLRKRADF
jgi:hypothetical protein